MADDPTWRLLLPPSLRTLPADLAAVVGWTLATVVVVFAPVVRATPLRVVLGLPFVLFVPGYALVAALFPEAGDAPTDDAVGDAPPGGEAGATPAGGEVGDASPAGGAGSGGIDGIERVALAFGLSIAVVPLIGLALNFTPFGIRLAPIMASVSLFTLAAAAAAVRRRGQVPAGERFAVPYRAWLRAGRAELFDPDSRTDGALNVLLVASVVIAMASVGYAVAVPTQGEAFTEFYLLTEQDDGELVAADYPTEFTVGESKPLWVGIGNHEHEPVQYAVVVELQDVRIANNSTTVLAEQELRRLRTTVPANETWRQRLTVAPETTGERLRLAVLLYRDGVPANQTVENAYRELHLWVNVTRSPAAG